MARPRIYKTQGVVLKQMPLGEADRILTFLTPDTGKLRAVARGVRRTKSRMGGHLEPLTQVSLSVALGRGLDTVSEAETIHSFRGLKEDLKSVSRAVYLAELVDGFSVEQSPNPTMYRLLLEALGRLRDAESPSALVRYFEVQLLKISGFGPELHLCVDCRSVVEPGDHVFSCARGGVLCPECRTQSSEALLPISINAMKVMRYFQREGYEEAAGLQVPSGVLSELERLLIAYVRYVLERELNSTDFMNLVSSAGRGGGTRQC